MGAPPFGLDRRGLLAAAFGAAAGLAAGCARQPVGPPTPTAVAPTGTASAPASATPTTPTPSRPASPTWPLTGMPLAAADEAAHIAVAVKVPDSRVEHPQVGLDAADLVFVELDGYRDAAGYSGTRLVPVFHSRMPDDVAPVRSIRPVDVPLLSPIRAIIGHTGGAGPVVDYVQRFVEFLVPGYSYMATRGTGAYSIDSSRVYQQHGETYYDRAVVCHPRVLASLTDRFGEGPPTPYLPFATSEAGASTADGRPARTLGVPWMPGDIYTMRYTLDESTGRYLRSMPWGPHALADGTRVATDNVLVVRSAHRYERLGGAGGEEPIHGIIDASGPFHYAHGGRYVTGTWRKGAVELPFEFTLEDGRPLQVAPGVTWVELARDSFEIEVD